MDAEARLNQYAIWIDIAEHQVKLWLMQAIEKDEQCDVDIRALNTAVTTLRRIIDMRGVLAKRKPDDSQANPAASAAADEEILALMESCLAEDSNRTDEEEVS